MKCHYRSESKSMTMDLTEEQQQEYDGYTNRDSSFNTIDTGSGFHHSMNSYLYIKSKHTTEPPSIIFKVLRRTS